MFTYAIETENLSKHFVTPRSLGQQIRRPWAYRQTTAGRTVVAVDQVSLQVHKGELFGLLGPNGAGKTTLIKLLCTLILPNSGRASVAGVDLNDSGRVRAAVGMASGDERSFYWRLSGRHNLEFFAALYGMSKQAIRQRIDQVLAEVDLSGIASRPFSTYSSGQKQRLSIARALLHKPNVLFLDEPTRSLDPTATMKLHDFIEEELLGRLGMTIFLTTHRLDEAQRLCHHIGIMHHGQLRAYGTVEELRAQLGPAVVYRLRVSGFSTWPASLAAGLPCQVSAQPANGQWQLTLESDDPEDALSILIARIIEAGGRVVAVDSRRLPLERVFERFTQV